MSEHVDDGTVAVHGTNLGQRQQSIFLNVEDKVTQYWNSRFHVNACDLSSFSARDSRERQLGI